MILHVISTTFKTAFGLTQHKRSFRTGARERIEQDQSESIPVLMMNK